MSGDRRTRPVAIAHRGSRYLWPENTMEAFSSAVAMGLDHIEVDLRATSDGVVVCLHDATVDRTTDGSGAVAGMTFDDMYGLDAGFRHRVGDDYPNRGRGVRVPRFEELVTSFPDVRIFADVKADWLTGAMARLARDHRLHDRLIVGSFRDRRLSELRRATGGRVRTSTGPNETRLWLLAARLGRRPPSGAHALQVPLQMRGVRVVSERLVRLAHRVGVPVHVWTVNRPDEMERLLDIDVDGLVTDRPDLAQEILAERGVT